MLGNGNVRTPFVHLDDVVSAVLSAAASPLQRGEVIHVLGKDQPTQNEVLRMCLGKGAKVVRIPRLVLYTLGILSEMGLGLLKRQSPLAVYRLKSGLAVRRFASKNAEPLLHWSPQTGVAETLARNASEDETLTATQGESVSAARQPVRVPNSSR